MTKPTPVQLNRKTAARLVGCIILLLSASVRAEDANPPAAPPQKADPTGSWIWSVPGRRNGPDLTNVLVMKVEGAAVTGQIVSPGRTGETNVLTLQDGKLSGNDFSFVVSRKFDTFTMTANYSGKVDGDTITGKIAYERFGRSRTNDWTAIRQSHKTDMISVEPEAADKK